MISKYFDFKSKDDMIIYEKIFYTGCQFSEAAFSSNDPNKERVIQVLQELMVKLAKVVDEIRTFDLNKRACEKKLTIEVQKGVTAIPTLELGKNIENFLTQSIGVLDIFATQFLKIMFGYSYRDWNIKEIIKHLKDQKQLCNEAIKAIEDLLNNAWNDWLNDLNYDRNLCHEANFGLSQMCLINNQPFMKLKRRNGKEIIDIMGFLQVHWNKLFWLVENMIRLSFWTLKPHLKAIFLSEFVSPFDNPR